MMPPTYIESLPKTTRNDLNMPIMELAYYQDMFIVDCLAEYCFSGSGGYRKTGSLNLTIFRQCLKKNRGLPAHILCLNQ
jgi:hypothetical protein